MIRTILLSVVAILFYHLSLFAQPTIKVYDVTASPGEILVQLDMLNFTGSNTFSAFNLEISFDDDLLVFTGIQNTSIAGTWFSNQLEGGASPLVVSFTSFGSSYGMNGKLLDLRFTYYGGFNTPLIFNTQYCEVANANLEIIPNIIYINGSVSQVAGVGTVSMEEVESPAGNVLMPVSMGGAGFGSITQTKLRVAFDKDNLSYQSIENAVLPGFTASVANDILTFEWTGSAQNFSATTKVFDIAFNYTGTANAALEFLPGSFIKSGSSFLATDYVNGLFITNLTSWTGAVNSDWDNPGNWSGSVPGLDNKVVIAPSANNPVIGVNAGVGELLIEAGTALSIAPNGSLTVSTSLQNNAGTNGLLILSDADATGSLIYGSGNVSATVQRFIGADEGKWRQLSSPVLAQDIEDGFSGGSFFSWFEPAQSWVSLSNNIVWPTWDDVNNNHKNFIPGKGYLITHPNASIPETNSIGILVVGSGISRTYYANQTITAAGNGNTVQVLDGGNLNLLAGQNILLSDGFSVQAGGGFHAEIDPDTVFYTHPDFAGTLNHGPINIYLNRKAHPDDAYEGFNLLGNPYPSSIDWKALAGWSGRENLEQNGGGYTIWVWNGESGNFGSYNSASLVDDGTNGASRYVAPTQGYWVKALTNQGVLGMSNAIRTHSMQEWLKTTPALADVLRLKVNGNSNAFSDEAILEFGHESSEGGAGKIYGMETAAPALYFPKDGATFSISFLADISGHPQVNLGFEAGADAMYTLAIANADFFHDIILEDLRDGRMQKLNLKTPYHFSARTVDEPNRFVLHFKALGTDPLEFSHELTAWAYKQMLYVLNPGGNKTSVEVYNPAGMLLKTWEINGESLQRLQLDLPPGIYMVKLQGSNMASNAKILVY
ncbi:MAG: T9SS type A sorting domain-containing protein [Bacteroidales bacterium]|nr:T9SS type A sorting domain-containing protein [Bacteroidales bacterium]